MKEGKLAYCVMHAEKISPPRLLLAIFHPLFNTNLKFLGLFGLPHFPPNLTFFPTSFMLVNEANWLTV